MKIINYKKIMLTAAIVLTLAGCQKKPVGGVDLTGVDIENISSNSSTIMKDDGSGNATKAPEAGGDAVQPATKAPEATKAATAGSVTLLSVGDNLYHGNIIKSGQSGNKYNFDHIYAKMKKEISAADLAVVNQETIFVSEGKKPEGYPSFVSPNEIADALKVAGFDVVLQASNHTADNGTTGITHTLDKWSGFPEMTVLGINKTKEDVSKINVIEKNGIKIALLNYAEMSNQGLPAASSFMLNMMSEDRLKNDIAKAKECADFIIVFPHWGTEYTLSATAKQKKWAQFMADQGVDLVIGTHPHVIEPVEWVKGADGHNMLVYYSLGNFVSRQIECSRVLGGMAKVTISKTGDDAKISAASATPLMMHYEKNPSKNTYAIRLDQYTEKLASEHGVKYFQSVEKFSFAKVKEIATKVFGSTTETKIEIK